MKIYKIAGIMAIWALVIALFFGFQEWMNAHSVDIWVKTVPVDPRDFFRGEYMRLEYDFSTFNLSRFPEGTLPENLSQVYAVLKEEKEEGIHVLDYFSSTSPEQESVVFLRGKPAWGNRVQPHIQLRYNLESYFVPEGMGPKLERELFDQLKIRIRVNQWGWAQIIEVSTDDSDPTTPANPLPSQ